MIIELKLSAGEYVLSARDIEATTKEHLRAFAQRLREESA